METSVTLFDFTTTPNLLGWAESSDTVRNEGMSKASFVLQKTQIYQRAVLFTLLLAQPDGAGFAGVGYYGDWDLRNHEALHIECWGHGEAEEHKIYLRHKGQEGGGSYQALFKVGAMIIFHYFIEYFFIQMIFWKSRIHGKWIVLIVLHLNSVKCSSHGLDPSKGPPNFSRLLKRPHGTLPMKRPIQEGLGIFGSWFHAFCKSCKGPYPHCWLLKIQNIWHG